ncbi:MAG: hypothetical protein Q4D65_08070 [Peptostreptococcaceae bacterium]|nr:hypothetical protein [Peptostreptococcaceae bacterium]
MNRIETIQITEEIARVLKTMAPTAKVHLERIDKKSLPAFSIEVVSDTSTVISSTHEQRNLTLDIIYYSQSNRQSEAIEMSGNLMAIFLPTFRLDNEKTFTFHQGVQTRFVEQDLHFLIEFDWRQSITKSFVDEDNKFVTYDTTDETKAVVANRLHEIEKMKEIQTIIERG